MQLHLKSLKCLKKFLKLKIYLPDLKLLKLAKEAGVRITFGSDAHAPGEIGAGLEDALELAKTAGYRSHVVFQKRQAKEIAF